MKTILVLNTGSSSVKASLFCPASEFPGIKSSERKEPFKIFTAHGEQLGTEDSFLRISISATAADSILQADGSKKELKHSHSLQLTSRATDRQDDHDIGNDAPIIETIAINEPNMSHKTAILAIIDKVKAFRPELMDTVTAVGHRVVHGGDKFSESVVVTDQVFREIQSFSHLAPLHNPSNLEGIRIARDVFSKEVPSVAVFDTAFHASMPRFAYTYPLPKEYSEHGIRKYGFHGTSVKYVSQVTTRILKEMNKDASRMIIAHLGNGASVTAVVDGKGVDTSMEFTPLSGLMMGTRSGTIDPSIVTYASEQMGKTPAQVISDLNNSSGLSGITGGDNDMRIITERASNGDRDALLAIEMFVYTLSKYIAGFLVSCGGSIDALVFTAGIGEHSPLIRELTIKKLSKILGDMNVDNEKNDANGKFSGGIISASNSSCLAMVVPTDEEVMICKECEEFILPH